MLLVALTASSGTALNNFDDMFVDGEGEAVAVFNEHVSLSPYAC